MEDYLSSTVTKLKSKDYASVTIVLGNESCDLDSAISSLVYAVFLHWQYQQIQCGVCTRVSEEVKHDIFVPVLDVDREDYEVKTEVAFCLNEVGVTKENLVFRDDINIQELVQTVTTNVVLVDHHNLSKKYEFLAPYVTEIIDHRPLDRTSWQYREDVRSTIEVVGSCGTLIGQRIKDLSALLSRDVAFFNKYPVCARLLHSVILLDTVNFSKELNKATIQDEEMVVFLENLLKINNREEERKTIVDRLVAARSDVSKLTAAQLLRKDVKVLEDILVPSFPILVEVRSASLNFISLKTRALATQDAKSYILAAEDAESRVLAIKDAESCVLAPVVAKSRVLAAEDAESRVLAAEDAESSVSASQKTIVDRLVAARSDVSKLTAAQLLRKDVKVLEDILVPSFPILVEEFLSKPDALQAVASTLEQRGCRVAVLLGLRQFRRDVAVFALYPPTLSIYEFLSKPDALQAVAATLEQRGCRMAVLLGLRQFRRDVAVFAPAGTPGITQLAQALQEWSSPPLQLSRRPHEACMHFYQGNLAASRKQYLPALKHYVQNR